MTNERLSSLAALHHKDFRLFWFGLISSVAGQQMLWVTEGWLIYELTGSKVLLGSAGLMRLPPPRCSRSWAAQ